jgi:predicted anti-sigma-YlaC factor YlaD
MDCNRIQDRLVDYLTEETRITERLCVDVHLATCYHCREAMEDVRSVLDAAQESTRYVGAERSFESAMNEIRTREALLATGHGRSGQQSRRWSWGIAASALPIVVACVTPFIVAWPGGSTTTMSETTSDATSKALLEPDSRLLDLTDPILTGRFDLLSPTP